MPTRTVRCLLLALALCPVTWAVPDTEIRNRIDAFAKGRTQLIANSSGAGGISLEDVQALGAKAMEGLAIDELGAGQAAELGASGVVAFVSKADSARIVRRMHTIVNDADAETAERLLAAAVGATVARQNHMRAAKEDGAVTALRLEMREFLKSHPDRFDAMGGPHASIIVDTMLAADTIDEVRLEDIEAVLGALEKTGSTSTESFNDLWQLAQVLTGRENAPMPASMRERVRAGAERAFAAELEKARAAGDEDTLYYEEQVAYFRSPVARGTLIGGPAPALEVKWCSDESVTSLDDLKGRVVVLDFWATWCGPCVASFPNIAELRERYPSEHVVILGVTSPQGGVVGMPDASGAKNIDAGSVEHEIELLQEYAAKKGITWDTLVLEGDAGAVFHPGYGVRGIPHVAIIDAAGVVRHNALHPKAPGKTAKIDALLLEAGLPVPQHDG